MTVNLEQFVDTTVNVTFRDGETVNAKIKRNTSVLAFIYPLEVSFPGHQELKYLYTYKTDGSQLDKEETIIDIVSVEANSYFFYSEGLYS